MLAQAASDLDDVGHSIQRIWWLIGIARRLPEPERSQMLNQSLATALALRDQHERALALIEIAPLLSESQRDEMLELALKLASTDRSIYSATSALTELASVYAALGSAGQAAAAIREIPSELLRIRALADIAPAIVGDARLSVYSIWSEVLQALSTQPRAELLKALPALRTILDLLGDEQAGAEMTRTIQEVGQAWP